MPDKPFVISLSATLIVVSAIAAAAYRGSAPSRRELSNFDRPPPALPVTPAAYSPSSSAAPSSSRAAFEAEIATMCRTMAACMAPGLEGDLVRVCTRTALEQMGSQIGTLDDLNGLPAVTRGLRTLNTRCAGQCGDIERCYTDGIADAFLDN